jgi:hypothetical protein
MRIFLFVFLLALIFLNPNPSYAQTTLIPEKAQSGAAVVTASVGDNYLNVNGYQSPNASIVIQTASGIFLESTTADGNGYFSITNILITDDFPGFCFTAIDFRRIGESESCVDITEVVTESQTYSDIFLPPTIGLSRKLIAEGEDAQIFGYSMPQAQVDIKFEGESITLQADETGYYEFIYEDVPAGVYAFSSKGKLNGIDSLEPKNKAILEVLTLQEQIRQDLTGFIEDVERKFPGAIILISLLILLIALLIALIWKTKPKFIYAFFDKFKKRYPMHHDYFLFKQ